MTVMSHIILTIFHHCHCRAAAHRGLDRNISTTCNRITIHNNQFVVGLALVAASI